MARAMSESLLFLSLEGWFICACDAYLKQNIYAAKNHYPERLIIRIIVLFQNTSLPFTECLDFQAWKS